MGCAAWFVLLTLSASLCELRAQSTNSLVVDDFSGAAGTAPETARWDFGGQVVHSGAGQLGLHTDLASQSWVRSKTNAIPGPGQTLILQFRAYAYAEHWNPGVYGDGQPRGLRVGSDANNAVEFYSVTRTSVGLRTRKDGVQTQTAYAFPAGVDSMHDYAISVTATSVCFTIDGVVAGTFTSNIPTGALNVYVSTSDGGAGNVPVSLDSAQLLLASAESPPPSPNVTAWGTPGDVPADLTNAIAISAGNGQSLALRADGTVAGWNGPAVPAGLTDIVAVDPGEAHCLALRSNGTVVAWGGNNGYGQRNIPAGLSNVVAIAAGGNHNLALRGDGTVAAWGINWEGQCNVPAGLSNVVAIAASGWYYASHSVALRADGTVVAWGYNLQGQCNVPAGLSNVVGIAAGNHCTFAIRADGTVVAWGLNNYGQANVPASLTNALSVSAGYHGLGLRADGTVIGWGFNQYGQASGPTGVTNVAAIAAGDYHSLALRGVGRPFVPPMVHQFSARLGRAVFLNANPSGERPLNCQWRKDGENLPGATNAVLTIHDAQFTNAGNYQLIVSNPSGSITSHVAVLSVTVDPPTITSFTPTNGFAGTVITVNGTSFSTVSGVKLNQTDLPFTIVSDTQLTATVPAGATSGLLAVTNPAGSAASLVPFLVFSPETDFYYTTSGGAVTITGYKGPGGTVSVPNRIAGLPVTQIGNYAFESHGSITNLVLSDGLLSIGWGAFRICGNLLSVTLPNTLTNIANGAFMSCGKLTSVTLPASVTSLGDFAFGYCVALTNITADPLNPSYSSADGVLFDKNQTVLLQFPCGRIGAYTIPATVASIGTGAFIYARGLTNLTIPGSVTNIGNQAFHFCVGLTAITIPDSVVRLGYSAFYQCTNLTSVVIPDGITDIPGEAFESCYNLASVVTGSGVTNIGFAAFMYCPKLTSITFGSNLKVIGSYAFDRSGLRTVFIPASVTTIGDWAFAHCPDLASVVFLGNPPGLGGGDAFAYSPATLYYMPGVPGWTSPFAGRSALLWNLNLQAAVTAGLQFTITGPAGIPIRMEASTNLSAWVPLHDCTLTNGSIPFRDADWTNHPARFYRVRTR